MKRRAVFLDRDGTINKDVGYPGHFSRIKFFPTAAEALRLIHRLGFLAVVMTNQSGVGRGFFSEDDLDRLHARMADELRRKKASLDGIYYCPHFIGSKSARYDRDCACRKPKPGLGRRAASDLAIDLKRSFMVGDKVEDVEFGWALGARPILVLTGFGRRSAAAFKGRRRRPVHVARNLLAAVRWIGRQERIQGRPSK